MPKTSSNVVAALSLLTLFAARDASAFLVNGDFETGDLTGWTISAIDGLGDPTTPLIAVATVGGNSFAELDTGTFATGPFVSTLEQTFNLDRPLLRFDFSLPTTQADASGTGASPFLDSFAASIQNGVDFFDLLLVDSTGPTADPFGTAPGTVALGAPTDPSFDFSVTANLSSLLGQPVTVSFFDVINEDDGLRSLFNLDNVILLDESMRPPVIPEPSALLVWGLGILLTVSYGWSRRKRPAWRDRISHQLTPCRSD